MQGQFADEAADAFHPDAVEDDQGEHGEGHAQGRVRVGGRYGAEEQVLVAGDLGGQHRDPVHRDQVDGVHQEDPDEDGQRQRGDQRVTAVEGVFDVGVDEVDHHFHQILQATGNAGGGLLGRHAEQEDEQQTEADGPAQGVHVERPEAHFLGLFGGVGEAPLAGRQLTEGQVLQVVLDIARSGLLCHVCLKRPKVSNILFSSAGERTS